MRIDRIFTSNYMIEEGILVAPGRERLFLARETQTGPWVAVTFKPVSSSPWAARFQGSLTDGLTAVATTPDPNRAAVIVSGQPYLIDCKHSGAGQAMGFEDVIEAISCVEDAILVLGTRWGAVGIGLRGIAWEYCPEDLCVDEFEHHSRYHLVISGMSYLSGEMIRRYIRCATGDIVIDEHR